MRKYFVIVLSLIFLAGCGGEKDSTQPYKGVASKKDYVALGMKFLSESDVQRAIQSFDMAIRQDPKNVENYLILGQVYMRLNGFTKAIDTFSAATKVDENNGEAFYFLALASMLNGDKELAVNAVQKSAEIFLQQKDEEKLKRSLVLYQSFTSGDNEVVAQHAADSMKTAQ